MGLAEKRMVAECQSQFNSWKQKVQTVCGKDLQYTVEWDKLVKEGFLEFYPQTVDLNFFAPLATALKSICADNMGKEAFTSKISKVKITCDRNWSSLEAKVEGDTLHLDADPSYGKTDYDCSEYAKRITEALEQNL